MESLEEDELLLAVLKELRRKSDREDALRAVLARVTDSVVALDTTCARLANVVERLEHRIVLLPGVAE